MHEKIASQTKRKFEALWLPLGLFSVRKFRNFSREFTHNTFQTKYKIFVPYLDVNVVLFEINM